MPIIGQTARGREIEKKSADSLYIWSACEDCEKERWVMVERKRLRSRLCRSCSNRKTMTGLRGVKARNWRGGRYMKSDNYVHVHLDPGDFFFSMAGKGFYVLEHRLVMAKHLNRCLLPWEVVHHKNGIKNDNRLENLELLPHKRHHLVDIETKAYIKRLETELHSFKKLLAEGKLVYVDREAELPKLPENYDGEDSVYLYYQAQDQMLKAGWIKERK